MTDRASGAVGAMICGDRVRFACPIGPHDEALHLAWPGAVFRVIEPRTRAGLVAAESISEPSGIRYLLRPESLQVALFGKAGVRRIIDAVAGRCGITAEDILAVGRRARFTKAKAIAMWLACKLTNLSLTALGRAFGGRHHTTILHARNAAAKRMECDPDFALEVRVIANQLGVML